VHIVGLCIARTSLRYHSFRVYSLVVGSK